PENSQLLVCLLRRQGSLQPSSHFQKVGVAQCSVVFVHCQRHDRIRLRRRPERSRQHTDHFVRVSIKRDRFADNRCIGAKSTPPEGVGQQHCTIPADSFFISAEIAAKRRLHAEDSEEPGRDQQSANPFWFTATGHVHERVFICRHRRKRSRLGRASC